MIQLFGRAILETAQLEQKTGRNCAYVGFAPGAGFKPVDPNGEIKIPAMFGRIVINFRGNGWNMVTAFPQLSHWI